MYVYMKRERERDILLILWFDIKKLFPSFSFLYFFFSKFNYSSHKR